MQLVKYNLINGLMYEGSFIGKHTFDIDVIFSGLKLSTVSVILQPEEITDIDILLDKNIVEHYQLNPKQKVYLDLDFPNRTILMIDGKFNIKIKAHRLI